MYNDNVRGIIVMGSAASVNDNHKWQQNISDIMVDASSKGIPVLGLCYGHQLIGHTYGGKVGPLWSGEKKQGKRVIHLAQSKLWGESCSAHFYILIRMELQHSLLILILLHPAIWFLLMQ